MGMAWVSSPNNAWAGEMVVGLTVSAEGDLPLRSHPTIASLDFCWRFIMLLVSCPVHIFVHWAYLTIYQIPI